MQFVVVIVILFIFLMGSLKRLDHEGRKEVMAIVCIYVCVYVHKCVRL